MERTTMMRWLFGRVSPHAEFGRKRSELLQEWFAGAARTGSPRGLEWISWDEQGEAVQAKDTSTGQHLMLVPVVVQFEPIEGEGLDDVPQAREPRAVVVVVRLVRKVWIPDGRAIFNLSPQQLIERSGGRWVLP